MMSKTALLSLIFLLFGGLVFGQDTTVSSRKEVVFKIEKADSSSSKSQVQPPINTDRPDQSESVYTLPEHRLQLETGLLYGHHGGNYWQHDIMLRYGLFKGTGVRLDVNYGRDEFGIIGLSPVELSVKRHIIHQHGAIPAISALVHVGLPFLATTDFRPQRTPYGLSMLFENDISDQFSLSYNAGVYWDGERTQPNWLTTLSFGYAPFEKWSFFAEYFADFSNGLMPNHNADFGVLWLVRNNCQLDFAFGTSLFEGSSANRFTTVGFSYRFGR